MREIVLASSNGVSPSTPALAHVPPTKKVKPAAKPNSNKWAANGLSEAVLVAARARKTFTIPRIVEDMKATGFQFVAKNPRVAVHKVIEKLAEKGAVRIAEHGTGNTPHTYEYVSG